MLEAVFSSDPNVEIVAYEGLTVEFCKKIEFISYVLIDKDYVDIIALQEAFETFLHLAIIAIKRMEYTRFIIKPNVSNEQAKK